MSYRFNNGQGGVTCDQCNILIDQDLSYQEYEETWGKSGDDGDFCMKCKAQLVIDNKPDKYKTKAKRV